MKQLMVLLYGAMCFVIIAPARGENWCSHRIIIVVQKNNEIAAGKTNISLTAGSAFSRLKWKTDLSPKKITVSTGLTSANSGLQVEAVDCVGGITTGRIPLVVSDQDFVTSISNLTGMCILKYSIDNRVNKNSNARVHTVFYTITDTN